ncbi:hypothetical protein XBKB1_1510010 [Xenorhabdus bovienii str. kraussei Becker Underwood]|uniref:Uncharacterized protein n=1 Tax=Xenorhabdus bovienii str. kraussei Becker Underwood TaxID=1398204 RepID=A0A077PQ56_XENBV|nr:hypothetical protein XBKB1_1510010 [Xenorhabdus bovienii str. kraussei Becker Underwood]
MYLNILFFVRPHLLLISLLSSLLQGGFLYFNYPIKNKIPPI